MKQALWKKADRRYLATLQRNLFAEWVVHREWWGITSKRHGAKSESFDDYSIALKAFTAIEKRRKSRGYERF